MQFGQKQNIVKTKCPLKSHLARNIAEKAFSSLALKRWLEEEEIEVQINTKKKNGVADVAKLHKTTNEKIRIINSSDDEECSACGN